MKVAIITITGEANYGNRFQNYAVQNVLEKLGIEAVTFRHPTKEKRALKDSAKELIKNLLHRGDSSRKKRIKIFDEFDNKYIHYDEVKNSNNYDYFVCGSDQIWNPRFKRTADNLDFYFADFAPKEKRVAYAASIGIDYIPDNLKEKFRKNFMEMKAISVREKKAAQLIKEVSGKDATVIVDPTLMLDKNDWLKITKKPDYIGDEKIILTYFIGEVKKETLDFINRVADKYNCRIIALTSEWYNTNQIADFEYYYTDPSEFMWLISNCEIVYTDSFHACVFSIIMNKPFRYFFRFEEGIADMRTRLDTLFGKFEISDWCVGDSNEKIENAFYKDYTNTEEILALERNKAYNYLKTALDIKD